MKLFRSKNRGPKNKQKNGVGAESSRENERIQSDKRYEANDGKTENTLTTVERSREIDAEIDDFKARLDSMMNTRPVENGANSDTDRAVIDSNDRTKNQIKRSSQVARKEKPTPKTKKNKPTPKKKQKKANTFPLRFKILLLVIVALVTTIVVLMGPMMAIDKVEVNDLKYVSEDKVLEMTGNPAGKNLFLFSKSKAKEELLKYPYIEDVTISRHLPHRLEINITERQPAGVLLNNSNYLQFSKDGILLNNTKSLSNQRLPLISGFKMEDVPAPGGAFKDDDRFKDCLRIINACDDALLGMLQEINIKDRNNILAYTSQGIEIRIGSVDNVEVRMATLNDIINQVILSNVIEEPIEAIDIRYEKSPVVVLEGYTNLDVSDVVEKTEEGESIQEKNDRANRELEEAANQNDSTNATDGETSEQTNTNDADSDEGNLTNQTDNQEIGQTDQTVNGNTENQ